MLDLHGRGSRAGPERAALRSWGKLRVRLPWELSSVQAFEASADRRHANLLLSSP